MGFDIIEEVNKMAEGRMILSARKLSDGQVIMEINGDPEEIWVCISAVTTQTLASMNAAQPLASRQTMAAACGGKFRRAVEAGIRLFVEGVFPNGNGPADV